MRGPRREGILTLTFGLWYGVSRIVEDSLRIDKRFFGLTGSQWTALTVATLCAALLVWFALHPAADAPVRPPGAAGPGDEPEEAPAGSVT
jgi:prolipoprotein diacylglyceryltransferase